jgi:preprotein translocase subunit YajC
MLLISTLLAQGEAVPHAGQDAPSLMASIIPLLLIFVLFYFMFILPQKNEQKKLQEMLKSLKEGDKVLTAGGIVGIITGFSEKDDIVQIRVGESTKLNVLRSYIVKKLEKPQ